MATISREHLSNWGKVLVDGTVSRDGDGKWLLTIQTTGTGNRETILSGYWFDERADAW